MPELHSVLVTGGSGLIGRAAVAELLGAGIEVTVFDRAGTAPVPDAAYVAGDVLDADALAVAAEGHDALVHLAGIAGKDEAPPEVTYAINTSGTFNALHAAVRVGAARAVYASSINASGLPLSNHPVLPSRYPYDESEPADISDWYSLSKQANEDAAVMVHRRWGLPVTGLRFPLVRDIRAEDGRAFGRHIRAGMITDARRATCEGWSYLDVRDAGRAVLAALTSAASSPVGILVAAPVTYLSTPTEAALDRYAPGVPRRPAPGRQVPIDLGRASQILSFRAETILDDTAPGELIDISELA